MSDPRIMAKLLFSVSDLEPGGGDREAQEPDELDRVECVLELEPLGGNLYRVPGPTTPTPFGPFGTGFTMGQVIEAELVQGEYSPAFIRVGSGRPAQVVLQYVATCDKPAVWTQTGAAEEYVMETRYLAEQLDVLRDHGCEWEWAVGNLSIQGPGARPSPEVQTILDDLEAAIARVRSARARDAQGTYRWQQAGATAAGGSVGSSSDAAAVVAAMHRNGWWPKPPDGVNVANADQVTAALSAARDDAQYMRGIFNLCRDHYSVTVRHLHPGAFLEDLGGSGLLDHSWYAITKDLGMP